MEYPSEGSLPSPQPVSGAGLAGAKVLPTLASFSLKGKTAIVTGGARGLGLVMGQGIVVSGADLAIVDLNGTYTIHIAFLHVYRWLEIIGTRRAFECN